MNSTSQVFFRNCYATEFLIDEDKNVRTNKMNVVFKWLQRNYFLQMFDSGYDCSNADPFDTLESLIIFRYNSMGRNFLKCFQNIQFNFLSKSPMLILKMSSSCRSPY